jgi:3-hydroxyacyl-[acyl-carrier-protein] dehydratase
MRTRPADFFSTLSVHSEGSEHTVLVRLHADHAVYSGHFPGNPVAPGVLLTDMVRRVAGQIIGHDVRLASARQIKFLQVINPNVVRELVLNIRLNESEQGLSMTCSASAESVTYFKFIGELA